jgi:hypothetical protein
LEGSGVIEMLEIKWQLNGTHQLLVYVDDVNILGRIVYTMRKNAETLVVASKEAGLEVNADKHVVMSRDQNAGRSHNTMIDNSSLESVEQFRYLGTNLFVSDIRTL